MGNVKKLSQAVILDLYVSFIQSFIHQWLYSALLGPGLFFSFVIFFTQPVGLLQRMISPSQGCYLHRTTQTQNKSTHKHPWLGVGFEPTIPAFEREKTVHALDSAATVIGPIWINISVFKHCTSKIEEK
jgi:hypothetical protein